jgi:hypothetical protein
MWERATPLTEHATFVLLLLNCPPAAVSDETFALGDTRQVKYERIRASQAR